MAELLGDDAPSDDETTGAGSLPPVNDGKTDTELLKSPNEKKSAKKRKEHKECKECKEREELERTLRKGRRELKKLKGSRVYFPTNGDWHDHNGDVYLTKTAGGGSYLPMETPWALIPAEMDGNKIRIAQRDLPIEYQRTQWKIVLSTCMTNRTGVRRKEKTFTLCLADPVKL